MPEMWIGRAQSKKNPDGIESICYPASITNAGLQSMHEIHTLLVAVGGESEKGSGSIQPVCSAHTILLHFRLFNLCRVYF